MELAYNHPSFKWVESPEHGGGGPTWVEVCLVGRSCEALHQLTTRLDQDHIESFITVAGTHLVRPADILLIGDAYCEKGRGTFARKGFLSSRREFLERGIFQAKAMAAFLSGEMKDTVQMNPAGAYGLHPTPCCRLTVRC